jgi:hypothetical protein
VGYLPGGAMRAGGFFHPNYATHVRPTVNSSQIARVEVFKPTGEHPSWEPGVGMENNLLELVWLGQGRVQPNIDWRARVRNFSGEYDATHAVRVQLPIGKNEFGGEKINGEWVKYGEDPNFSMGYVVRVKETPVAGTELLFGRDYTVRNALPSSNMWLYNLLCDTGTTPNKRVNG